MKNYLHFLLLTTIIVLKLSSMALHIYVHHDDDQEENCELCVDALTNQDIDSSIPEQLGIIDIPTFNFSEEQNFYKSVFIKLSTDNVLFGRPPPSLI